MSAVHFLTFRPPDTTNPLCLSRKPSFTDLFHDAYLGKEGKTHDDQLSQNVFSSHSFYLSKIRRLSLDSSSSLTQLTLFYQHVSNNFSSFFSKKATDRKAARAFTVWGETPFLGGRLVMEKCFFHLGDSGVNGLVGRFLQDFLHSKHKQFCSCGRMIDHPWYIVSLFKWPKPDVKPRAQKDISPTSFHGRGGLRSPFRLTKTWVVNISILTKCLRIEKVSWCSWNPEAQALRQANLPKMKRVST